MKIAQGILNTYNQETLASLYNVYKMYGIQFYIVHF